MDSIFGHNASTNTSRILEEGEAPPTSESLSLAGYLKARPGRNKKSWKTLDSMDAGSPSESYYDSVQPQDDAPNDALRACIRNIPQDKDLDNTKLRYGLSKTCDVTYVDIHKRRGFAFVSFKSLAALKAAIAANPHFIGGHELYVEEHYQPDDETRNKRDIQRQQIDSSVTPRDRALPEPLTRGPPMYQRLSVENQRSREPENTILCRCETSGDLSVFHWSRTLGNFYFVGSVDARLADRYQRWVKFLLAHPRFRDENNILKRRAIGNAIASMVKALNSPDRQLYTDPFSNSTTLLGSEPLFALPNVNSQNTGKATAPTGQSLELNQIRGLQSVFNQTPYPVSNEFFSWSNDENQPFEAKASVPKRTLDRTLQWQKRLEEAKLVEQATEHRRRLRSLYLEARKEEKESGFSKNDQLQNSDGVVSSPNTPSLNERHPTYVSKSHVAQMAAHLDPSLAHEVRRTVLHDPFRKNDDDSKELGVSPLRSGYQDKFETLESHQTFQKAIERPKTGPSVAPTVNFASSNVDGRSLQRAATLKAASPPGLYKGRLGKRSRPRQNLPINSIFQEKGTLTKSEVEYEKELQEWWTSGIEKNASLDRWSDLCLASSGIDQAKDPKAYRDAEVAVKLIVPLIHVMASYTRGDSEARGQMTNYIDPPVSTIDIPTTSDAVKTLFEDHWDGAVAAVSEHRSSNSLPDGGVSLSGWNGPGPVE